MSIRSLCAAAVVAVGVGQAEAATIVSYDIAMRYEGTYYDDVSIYHKQSEEYYSFDRLVAETSEFKLPNLRKGLKIGDEVAFRATLVVPDDPHDYSNWPDYYAVDNGGRARDCKIAKVNCIAGVTATFLEQEILFGEYGSMYFSKDAGSKFSYTFNEDHWSSLSLGWGDIQFFNRTASFSILSYSSTTQPAPVPLPFGAALLPVGIGALALMRRRRPAPGQARQRPSPTPAAAC